MFQFPAFALLTLYIQVRVTGSLPLGFPIQKSADQRSFASFPKLIAGYHVFRRLSMPRHPPCTLSSLTTFTEGRSPGRGKTVMNLDLQVLRPFNPDSSPIDNGSIAEKVPDNRDPPPTKRPMSWAGHKSLK